MNATDGDGAQTSTTPGLFAEIAELKRQRDDCARALAECRQENQQLRARLGEDS